MPTLGAAVVSARLTLRFMTQPSPRLHLFSYSSTVTFGSANRASGMTQAFPRLHNAHAKLFGHF